MWHKSNYGTKIRTLWLVNSITWFKAPDLDIDEAATLEHEAAETAQDVPGGRARVDERRCKNGTVHQ